MTPGRPIRRGFGGLALAALALGGAGGSAGASASAEVQSAGTAPTESTARLAIACAAETSAGPSACRELALAAASVQRGVGLAAALGSDIPGSSSTMGRRIGRMPRIGISVAAMGVRIATPGLAGAGLADLEKRNTGWVTGLRFGAAAGVLDGFQLATAVGGVLSVDVVASYSLLRLPAAAGFDGWSSGGGAGLRVGLVRESFTLPGVSVSAMRRWRGEVRAGAPPGGGAPAVETDVVTTSLRATAGKNWFLVGLLGGIGWDRCEGDARLSASSEDGMDSSVEGRLRSSRRLYFAGAWFNYLVSRMSVEAGLAEGVANPFPDRTGAFDPGESSWFVSAAVRITL